ncbi:MAG: helix-turn-helix transcriptional regulator [Gammaproteobacteria bacterium]|nr:helix-turn-helix transcriptional regulator [Gammaproteobacteria bacterium]
MSKFSDQSISKPPTILGAWIRELREREGYGREEFCRLTEIKKRTLIGIESEGRDPSGEVLRKIAVKFPKQAAYLLLGIPRYI